MTHSSRPVPGPKEWSTCDSSHEGLTGLFSCQVLCSFLKCCTVLSSVVKCCVIKQMSSSSCWAVLWCLNEGPSPLPFPLLSVGPLLLLPPVFLSPNALSPSVIQTVYTVHCTLYTVRCTLYNVYSILYTVFCILYTVHCALCSVQTACIGDSAILDGCWRRLLTNRPPENWGYLTEVI